MNARQGFQMSEDSPYACPGWIILKVAAIYGSKVFMQIVHTYPWEIRFNPLDSEQE